MIPQREFDRIQMHLISALCNMKGYTIPEEQYAQLKPIIESLNIQIMTAVEVKSGGLVDVT